MDEQKVKSLVQARKDASEIAEFIIDHVSQFRAAHGDDYSDVYRIEMVTEVERHLREYGGRHVSPDVQAAVQERVERNGSKVVDEPGESAWAMSQAVATFVAAIDKGMEIAERLIDTCNDDSGIEFAESVSEKLEDIKLTILETGNVTVRQSTACQNMIGGLKRWNRK